MENIFKIIEKLINNQISGEETFNKIDMFLCKFNPNFETLTTDFSELNTSTQQQIVKIFFTYIYLKAKDYELGFFDDRNEYVVETSHKIIKLLEEKNIELPIFYIDYNNDVEDNFREINDFIIKLNSNHRFCQLIFFYIIRKVFIYNNICSIIFPKEIEEVSTSIINSF